MAIRILATLVAATAFAALIPAPAAYAEGGGSRLRLACRAIGATDISMAARYEVRGSGSAARRKFSTEFEAAPTAGFRAGQRLGVTVNGVRVGAAALEEVVGGDLVLDLNFDTVPQADASPFPSVFPRTIGKGTEIQVLRGASAVLGCALR